MNIFTVLSQGKARLHEPSISAVLKYLLTPTSEHGIGELFLRSFLELCQKDHDDPDLFKDILSQDRIDIETALEEQYDFQGKRHDIDIQLSIYDKSQPESKERYRIIIENKIKIGASAPNQLFQYYHAVLNSDDFKVDNPELIIIFITPKSDNPVLTSEYQNLLNEIDEKIGHKSIWLYWSTTNESNSILGLIRELLIKESQSDINPINEYMKHTLKAFVQHVKGATNISDRKKMRTGEDIGDIIQEYTIATNDGKKHKIIQRDSTQIQVYDLDSNDKEIARRIMAQYIDENKIDIDHRKFNTRMIGKKLLDYLANQI